jgi:serine/threonine-protein kinase
MDTVRSCHKCGLRYTASDTFCPADGSKLIDSSDEVLGTMIGNYRVVRMLGEGGMGQVYLALHPRIGSQVAIKVLSHVASTDSTLVERFFAEAHSVNKIRHEGIVNVLDLDQLPDGRPFITMEYLPGEPLSTSIRRGPLALGTSAGIVIEILGALQAAHDSGVVHRDLKPDNLFLSPQGRVKVLDFGVAKLMPHYEASLAKVATQSGALIGTPGYMAPEQVVGDPVSPATDIYAVGAILYEMLTGVMAFEGTSLFELFNRIVNDPPPPLSQRRPQLTGPYQDLIMRALSKAPSARFSSALEMADALRAITRLLGDQDWEPVPVLDQPPAPELGEELARRTRASIATANTRASPGPTTRKDPVLPLGRTLSVASEQRPPEQVPPPRHSVASSTAPGTSPVAKKSRGPWMALALLVLAGGIAAAVLAGGATKSTASDSLAGIELSDAGEAAVVEESVDEELVPPAPGDAGPSGPATPDQPDRKEPTRTPKPIHKKSTREGKAEVHKKEEQTEESEVSKKEEGTTSKGGVTFIETGNRHKDKQIHIPPDFKPKSFDAVGYVPRARKLAKKIYSDAHLVTFDVPGVAPSGRTNLPLANFEVTYKFLSPSHAKRTKPIGIEEDRPCWVYVEVNKKGTTARIVEWDECKGKARPNPKCSLKEVWDRAYKFGAPKSGAVASIDYLWDGWFFDIDALGVTESIPDDC